MKGAIQLIMIVIVHLVYHDRHRPFLIAAHACCISQDIGGYDIQKQEIREAVELPLTHAGLYQQLGIDPPRGVLLYGPPGESRKGCRSDLQGAI